MEILTALKDTPLPTLLVIGGFIFLFLGIATIKKPIVIDVQPPSNRKMAIFFGVIFVIAGLYSLLQSPSAKAEDIPTETPTMLAANITDTPISITPSETATPPTTSIIGFQNNCIKSDVWTPTKIESNENGCWVLPKSGIAVQDNSLILFTDKNQTIDWFGLYTPIPQNADIHFTIKVDKLNSPNTDNARIAFGIVNPDKPTTTGDFLYFREHTDATGRIEFGKAMLDITRVGNFDPTGASQKVTISVTGIVLNIFIDNELIVGPVSISASQHAFGIFYRPVKDSSILAFISDLQIEEK